MAIGSSSEGQELILRGRSWMEQVQRSTPEAALQHFALIACLPKLSACALHPQIMLEEIAGKQ